MRSFGKSDFKSLTSFGISGVLGEESEIYFNSVFSTLHVGRVSDLLSVCMTKAGIDEFKLRVLVLFGLFQGYYGQSIKKNNLLSASVGSVEGLDQPVTLECGVDQEKVAIGISFSLFPEYKLNVSELKSRVERKEPADFFESTLIQFQNNSDQLIFKYLPKGKRVEIISLMALERKLEQSSGQAKPPIEFILVDPAKADLPPKAKAYIDLGDLNYTQLLREPTFFKNKAEEAGRSKIKRRPKLDPNSREDAQRVDGAVDPDEEFRLAGDHDDDGLEDETRVKGGLTPESERRVKGKARELEQARVKGGERYDEEYLVQGKVVPGASPTQQIAGHEDDSGESSFKISGVTESIEDELIRIEGGQGQRKDPKFSERTSALRSVIKGTKSVISSVLGQVWPFNRKKTDLEEDEFETAPVLAPVTKAPKKEASPAVATAEVTALLDQIVSSDEDATLEQAEETFAKIKRNITDDAASKWAAELVNAVVKERARLGTTKKKLAQSLEKKEIEFEKQLRFYQEEIKRKDEQLSQRDNALDRAKEQMAQLNKHVERLKTTSHSPEEGPYRQKFSLMQKMLLSSKKESAQLARRVEELKNQLAATQANTRGQGPTFDEYAALQAKYDRAVKQAEEFKRANRQLLEHINEPKRNSEANANADELRHRLEASVKLAAASKKESDVMRSRMVVLQKQELNLKREVNRLQTELRRLSGNRQKINSVEKPRQGGGGSSNPPAAA